MKIQLVELAAIFQRRDEFAGVQESIDRVHPSRQGFEAAESLGNRADHRLEIDFDISFFAGFIQVVDHIVADDHRALHGRGVAAAVNVQAILDAVAGYLGQVASAAGVGLIVVHMVQADFHFQRSLHLYREKLLVYIDDTVLQVYIIGEHGEVVIGEAGNEIIGEGGLQKLGDALQQFIAGLQAEADVVGFEMTQVEIQNRNGRRAGVQAIQLEPFQCVLQEATLSRKAGESVGGVGEEFRL